MWFVITVDPVDADMLVSSAFDNHEAAKKFAASQDRASAIGPLQATGHCRKCGRVTWNTKSVTCHGCGLCDFRFNPV